MQHNGLKGRYCPFFYSKNHHQLDNSNHGPASKDLFFSNWLLMYFEGNYCYRINAIAPPPPKVGDTGETGNSGEAVISRFSYCSVITPLPKSMV